MRLLPLTSALTLSQLSDICCGFSPLTTITRHASRNAIWRRSYFAASTDGKSESNEEDDDFAAMRREIEAMMLDTPVTSPSAASSSTSVIPVQYNKLIAVASAVFGSFFFVFQHSQPVSGVALMHAMERDSVDLKVC